MYLQPDLIHTIFSFALISSTWGLEQFKKAIQDK